MKKVNWGILGLGKIALKFAEGIQHTKNAKLFAISSRDKSKLQTFKSKFNVENNYCFPDYESFLECKDMDIIYIALPNSFHHEWIIKSIDKGKNILVEKPATLNFKQINNIRKSLNGKKIFFSEAFMYRYLPQMSEVLNLLKNNIIGNLVSMDSVFGKDIVSKKLMFGIKLKKKLNIKNRLYSKELGGGAILDLGCYPISMSTLIASFVPDFNFNKIKVLNKKKDIGVTGVDMNSFVELDFGNNFKSTVGTSFTQDLGRKTKIVGDKGELVIEDTWHGNPSLISISGEKDIKIEAEHHSNIYKYEIEILSKHILENKKEPIYPIMNIQESYENMKILDEWLN